MEQKSPTNQRQYSLGYHFTLVLQISATILNTCCYGRITIASSLENIAKKTEIRKANSEEMQKQRVQFLQREPKKLLIKKKSVRNERSKYFPYWSYSSCITSTVR